MCFIFNLQNIQLLVVLFLMFLLRWLIDNGANFQSATGNSQRNTMCRSKQKVFSIKFCCKHYPFHTNTNELAFFPEVYIQVSSIYYQPQRRIISETPLSGLIRRLFLIMILVASFQNSSLSLFTSQIAI